MTRLTRRGLLKAGAVTGAAIASPLAVHAARTPRRITVFDSRIAESQAFARGAGEAASIDLAVEHDSFFAALRSPLPAHASVEGLTGWSDWIAIRGELEARGLRVTAEQTVAAPLSGKAHLFRWSMKAR